MKATKIWCDRCGKEIIRGDYGEDNSVGVRFSSLLIDKTVDEHTYDLCQECAKVWIDELTSGKKKYVDGRIRKIRKDSSLTG